jgi:hypothetical protein
MIKLLKNPLYIYVLGFVLTFLVYSLDWSAIYPQLSTGMKLFFAITFVFYVFFGFLIERLKLIKRTLSQTRLPFIQKSFYLLFILYALEFLIEKDIPLFAKLTGRSGVGYLEFGVPLLHGILISFNSFLIAHTFTTYMSTKNTKILRYNLLLYLPALLFISRSIMVFGLLTSLFIYLHFVESVKFKSKIVLAVLIVIGLYLFGVVGNLRSGGDYIYTQSKASEEFMESAIPEEFYWTYLYAASPLANFQNTVNRRYVEEYDFLGFVFYENLPQIISKNLGGPLNLEQRDLVRIVPWLTVGTTYAKSFSYLGWLGPYLLFIGNLLVYLTIIFFLVPRSSSYHITTIAILSVIVLMNIFSNMLIVTGISFQLVYCIIFAFFERKKIILKT